MTARRTSVSSAPKQTMELLVTQEEARQKLQERIDKGLILKNTQINTLEAYTEIENSYSKWDSFNSELLRRIFTTEDAAREYDFWGAMAVSLREPSFTEKVKEVHEDIDKKIHRIESISERLELIPLSARVEPTLTTTLSTFLQHKTKKVFVVHGHDEIAKTNLEVFLHEIGLEPIVLHRQADEGMTIIEKFEKYSDVGYAFILLTPDEIAYLANEQNKPEAQRKTEFRARQNVIFEFGYFVGKLGRRHVCCLYTGNVSLPSDISGMIYKRYEKSIDEVAYSITKDLKASGYRIT